MHVNPPETLIRRMQRDLLDSYDEALELEMEDGYLLDGEALNGPSTKQTKSATAGLFPRAVPAARRAGEAAGLGGQHQRKGGDPV